MAAGSTKARSAMARWSTTSPSTPIPARSSNGTWNPSTTEQNESGEREHEQNGTDRGGRGRRRRGQEGHRAGIERLFSTVQETLKQNDKVQIPGFGSFEVRERAARTGRNPHTGETIEIAAAKVPAFKPEKGLKDAIQ